MATENYYVFKFLQVIAWIIFIGLSIEAGALVVNFIFTIYRPEFVQNLYQTLDLTQVFARDKFIFTSIYSFILALSMLKAYLFYRVVMLLHQLDLAKPFSNVVANQISKISYFAFSIGLVGYIAQKTAIDQDYQSYTGTNLDQFWSDSQAFILMAAILYVIATIFKKGVELQNENDLTV